MSRLADRVAVVTGAAEGLGRAAAARLAAEGAVIEILDIKDASPVCQEIRAAGGKADSSICDVTDEAQIAKAADAIGTRHGKVDILVNNAVMPGMVATPGTRANSSEEMFDRVMQNQAIKRRVQPHHLAALIAFIASDDAEMITGQMILCDGGGYLH